MQIWKLPLLNCISICSGKLAEGAGRQTSQSHTQGKGTNHCLIS
jgi:hypothetical protein